MRKLLYERNDPTCYITLDDSGDLYACTEYGDCGSYLTPEIAVELARELIRWAVTQNGKADD